MSIRERAKGSSALPDMGKNYKEVNKNLTVALARMGLTRHKFNRFNRRPKPMVENNAVLCIAPL